MSMDLSKPEYWNELYLSEQAGWDKGQVAPPIARMLGEGMVLPSARIAVLGSGRGHEAFEAARRGFQVTAVDFAEEAAKAMRERSRKEGVQLEVLREDVFALNKLRPENFDAAIEHTCFCAIDVARRAEYAQMVHSILVPGGVFFGLFYAHGRPGGPPFTTDEQEVRALFSPLFEVERLKVAPDSFPNRAGHELEFAFRKAKASR
jgi:methyl halide transferase